jgi:hypothetical protein
MFLCPTSVRKTVALNQRLDPGAGQLALVDKDLRDAGDRRPMPHNEPDSLKRGVTVRWGALRPPWWRSQAR